MLKLSSLTLTQISYGCTRNFVYGRNFVLYGRKRDPGTGSLEGRYPAGHARRAWFHADCLPRYAFPKANEKRANRNTATATARKAWPYPVATTMAATAIPDTEVPRFMKQV